MGERWAGLNRAAGSNRPNDGGEAGCPDDVSIQEVVRALQVSTGRTRSSRREGTVPKFVPPAIGFSVIQYALPKRRRARIARFLGHDNARKYVVRIDPLQLRTRRSQVRVLQGAPAFSESFQKRQVRASVPLLPHPPETVIIRVADRVAGCSRGRPRGRPRHEWQEVAMHGREPHPIRIQRVSERNPLPSRRHPRRSMQRLGPWRSRRHGKCWCPAVRIGQSSAGSPRSVDGNRSHGWSRITRRAATMAVKRCKISYCTRW